MNAQRLIILLAFALILGVPFAFRQGLEQPPADALTLIVISPHNEQIRQEIGWAFNEWHTREHGQPAAIDRRRPGGSTEIRRLLVAQYSSAVSAGVIGPDGSCAPGAMPYDAALGGGSYEFGVLKRGVTVEVAGPEGPQRVTVPMTQAVDFDEQTLRGWFGENAIGAERLYDPDGHWFGTALSSFGIAFNRDALRALGLDEPRAWSDLMDKRYLGWLALADPRQSGSVATAYDSILTNYGWDEGWGILRAMSANARYFSGSSARVIIDVGSGDAAAAAAIDFYGRYESQALLEPGQPPESSRVGFVDPENAAVDPDPVAALRGGPHPELTRRFIEFLLSVEGQALWQFPATGEGREEGALGPRKFELRRLPARRDMYESPHFERFVDRINPFEFASSRAPMGWRSLIAPMMACFAIDVHEEATGAWRAMKRAEEAGRDISEMERLFFAFPEHALPDGRAVPFTEDNFGEIKADWGNPERAADLRIEYIRFFRGNYGRIERMGSE